MDYRIENIEIKTAKNQSEYVLLTLANPDDMFDEPFQVPIWNDIVINAYKNLLADPTVMGDVNKLPEAKRQFKYGFWEYGIELPQPMNRVWGSDVTTTRIVNGVAVQETHPAGSLVCDASGTPILYTKVDVFTKKRLDNNTNTLDYAKGWSLTERFNQMVGRQFRVPQTAVATQQVPTPGVQPTPTVSAQPATVQPIAGAQPAPQPGVAQPAPGTVVQPAAPTQPPV